MGLVLAACDNGTDTKPANGTVACACPGGVRYVDEADCVGTTPCTAQSAPTSVNLGGNVNVIRDNAVTHRQAATTVAAIQAAFTAWNNTALNGKIRQVTIVPADGAANSATKVSGQDLVDLVIRVGATAEQITAVFGQGVTALAPANCTGTGVNLAIGENCGLANCI